MAKDWKTVATAIGLGAVIAGAGALGGATLFPKEVTITKEVVKTVPGPTVYEQVNTPVEVIVEKIVPVDNGNLEMVLDELIERDGNVEYLTDGLDDDELDLIVERLFISQEWDKLAFDSVKAELADELDEEVVDGVEIDEDDVRSINLDVEDFTFEDIDWDDKGADVLVPFTFRQEDDRFEGVARVRILDGEVEEVLVEEVGLRE